MFNCGIRAIVFQLEFNNLYTGPNGDTVVKRDIQRGMIILYSFFLCSIVSCTLGLPFTCKDRNCNIFLQKKKRDENFLTNMTTHLS